MKVIIAGSRDMLDYEAVKQAVKDSGFEITTVISGKARGADALGERWARENGVPVDGYPADWNRYGKRAGFVRNREMAEQADALILVWDGRSPGSANMLMEAVKHGVKIHQRIVGERNDDD